jgi:glycosyltransferase involved in cell wall biosynthesis
LVRDASGIAVTIAHDWLNGMRGGERVLEAMLEIWPHAPIVTLFYEPDKVSESIRKRRVSTSFLDRIPGAHRYYRHLLPLFPRAIESLDVGGADLVISSSHAVAKGIRPRGAVHVCYCHTPMRYIWDADRDYELRMPERIGLGAIGPRLRSWDRRTANGVDRFVANSRFVARRIRSYYGRPADVVYPPVDIERFRLPRRPEDFYLWVGALVRYKKPRLAIEAVNESGRRLVVVGDGPERRSLERAAGSGVRFLGRVGDEELASLYSRARGLIFPAKEDFGIVAVEAAAAGCPSVAFNGGGAIEALEQDVNAVLFETQTPEDLRRALDRFEGVEWSESTVRSSATRFTRERFKHDFRQVVDEALSRQEGIGRR